MSQKKTFRNRPGCSEVASVGVVVLAAGGSARMGEQKLLMKLGGESLAHRAARVAVESAAGPVVVVVGSEACRVSTEVEDLPVNVQENVNWISGQASSVSCGIEHMEDCDAAMLMVADQPFVAKEHLNALVGAYRIGKQSIYVSKVGDRRGNPALFDRSHFSLLKSLKGDEGARQLFGCYPFFEVEMGDPLLFLDADDRVSFQKIAMAWLERGEVDATFPSFQIAP